MTLANLCIVIGVTLIIISVVIGIVEYIHVIHKTESIDTEPVDSTAPINQEDDVADKPITPLQEYYDALERGDRKGMEAALIKNADTCPSRNGYCLTDVFCPDCPLANGGLSVQSAQYGME